MFKCSLKILPERPAKSGVPATQPLASIDKCTTCASCVATCPVLRGTRKFNGPKLTGPSSERFRLLSQEEIESLDYCSNCKNCDITCPCGVQVSSLNMLARAEQTRRQPPPLKDRARDWVLSHGSLLAKMSRIFWFIPRPMLNFAMNNPVTRRILDWFGVDERGPLPVFAAHSFQTLFKREPMPPRSEKIVFFPGCYINDYDPQTGLDVVFLLRKAGYEVIVPDFSCCGIPLVANGFFEEARGLAHRNADLLKEWVGKGAKIVAACPSCTHMIREEYAELFPDVSTAHRPQVHDACAFIRQCLEEGRLVAPEHAATQTYIYHEPCHLRVQGGGKTGLELLRSLNIAVTDANADCCGISGSYGFKKGKYEVGRVVGEPLFKAVQNAGAEAALSECGTCRVQIAHHCGIGAKHPLSVVKSLYS